jgi:6-phosphogluconolactonase
MMVTAAASDAVTLREFADEAALATAVAQVFSAAVQAGIAARGSASVVLTGGTSPRIYAQQVAALDLPWARVTFTLSDERFVPPSDALSNERLQRELFLRGPVAAAQFVPLMSDAPDPERAAQFAAERVTAIAHPFDLVLLGFGADTHIASLFPLSAQFARGVAHDTAPACIAVTPPTGVQPAVPRLTLTLNQLAASRRVLIVARGQEKRAALRASLSGALPRPTPVALLAERGSAAVDFFWTP